MFAGRRIFITSAKRKKVNDQGKDKGEEDRIAVTACYTVNETFDKQRRFDKIETSEIFIVDDAANEEIVDVTVDSETTNDKGLIIVFDAISEKKNRFY